MRNMSDLETARYLLEYIKRDRGLLFAWPTDGCGYKQHIKFVHHRNANWHGGDWNKFVADYARSLMGILPCGHPLTAIISSDDGTNYCAECANGEEK